MQDVTSITAVIIELREQELSRLEAAQDQRLLVIQGFVVGLAALTVFFPTLKDRYLRSIAYIVFSTLLCATTYIYHAHLWYALEEHNLMAQKYLSETVEVMEHAKIRNGKAVADWPIAGALCHVENVVNPNGKPIPWKTRKLQELHAEWRGQSIKDLELTRGAHSYAPCDLPFGQKHILLSTQQLHIWTVGLLICLFGSWIYGLQLFRKS